MTLFNLLSKQLAFDLPITTAFGREDFLMSKSNALAVQLIENWTKWPQNKLILCGPSGSGKSHLAHIWKDQTGGEIFNACSIINLDFHTLCQRPICLEGMHKMAGDTHYETQCFHLYNLCQERQTPLLMTGINTPLQWGINLPDLKSRLDSTTVCEVLAPDDALLNAVMLKQFNDRQIDVDPKVITYLLPRIDRSFSAVSHIVKNLDKVALEKNKPITIQLARKILDVNIREI